MAEILHVRYITFVAANSEKRAELYEDDRDRRVSSTSSHWVSRHCDCNYHGPHCWVTVPGQAASTATAEKTATTALCGLAGDLPQTGGALAQMVLRREAPARSRRRRLLGSSACHRAVKS